MADLRDSFAWLGSLTMRKVRGKKSEQQTRVYSDRNVFQNIDLPFLHLKRG